jgi:hypothetical protein
VASAVERVAVQLGAMGVVIAKEVAPGVARPLMQPSVVLVEAPTNLEAIVPIAPYVELLLNPGKNCLAAGDPNPHDHSSDATVTIEQFFE